MRTDALGQTIRRFANHLAAGPTDGELLTRFVAGRQGHASRRSAEEAFAALLDRHGPMVWGVCRRVLGNAADADDAFQATFLVLARRADELAAVGSVAGWLHGVAARVSRKARVAAARRRARERGAGAVPNRDPLAGVDWADVRPVIDEELARLGDKYRAPVALCYLEGRSHEEAARLLGWPEGTVSGRLHRAKELLGRRLARRGITCPAAAVGVLLAGRAADAGPVPPALLTAVSRTAGGAAPSAAAVGLAAGTGWPVGRWLARAAAAGLVAGGWWLALRGPQPPAAPLPAAPAADELSGPVRVHHGSAVLTVAVSPAGVVATAGAGADVRMWSSAGEPLRQCSGHSAGVAAVTFSPDGRSLAAAGYDGIVRVWDVSTGKPGHSFGEPGEAILRVAFSPDGTALATASADGQVRAWDTKTGEQRWEAEGHRGRAWGVAYSPDGREVASAGGDQIVRVYEAATGRETRRIGGPRGGAYAVAYAPDGSTLAVAAGNTVVLLDARTGAEVGRVPGPGTAVTWFAFSPDGRALAYRDGPTVRVWEIASGQVRLAVDAAGEPTALAFGPGGRALAAAVGDGAVLWDLRRVVGPAADPGLLWYELGSADAARAYRAVVGLAADPARAVPLLRDRLGVVPDLAARIDHLIADFDAPAFADRDRAERELVALGADAAPALRRAVAETTSAEVRIRAERLLARPPGPDRLTPLEARAVEVLESAGTLDARAVLDALAARPADTPLRRAATAAAARLRRTR